MQFFELIPVIIFILLENIISMIKQSEYGSVFHGILLLIIKSRFLWKYFALNRKKRKINAATSDLHPSGMCTSKSENGLPFCF
jgi:hypothetical protein